jgi:hypothetical protein
MMSAEIYDLKTVELCLDFAKAARNYERQRNDPVKKR